jgi:hypothetical protein
MKIVSIFLAFVFGVIFLTIPSNGCSMTTLSVQFGDALRLISLDMLRKEVIETIGAPDLVKSEGNCLQYKFWGLSVFLNQNDRIEQIYISKDFQGTVGGRRQSGGMLLSDIEKEFGDRVSVEKLNYQPSTLIQTLTTTETENQTYPTGKQKDEFPLQYPGNHKLYIFYNSGKIIKYKYVLDEDGIAFWLDDHQQLYATVLYLSREERAALGTGSNP